MVLCGWCQRIVIDNRQIDRAMDSLYEYYSKRYKASIPYPYLMQEIYWHQLFYKHCSTFTLKQLFISS